MTPQIFGKLEQCQEQGRGGNDPREKARTETKVSTLPQCQGKKRDNNSGKERFPNQQRRMGGGGDFVSFFGRRRRARDGFDFTSLFEDRVYYADKRDDKDPYHRGTTEPTHSIIIAGQK
jgi:hypothetical protein